MERPQVLADAQTQRPVAPDEPDCFIVEMEDCVARHHVEQLQHQSNHGVLLRGETITSGNGLAETEIDPRGRIEYETVHDEVPRSPPARRDPPTRSHPSTLPGYDAFLQQMIDRQVVTEHAQRLRAFTESVRDYHRRHGSSQVQIETDGHSSTFTPAETREPSDRQQRAVATKDARPRLRPHPRNTVMVALQLVDAAFARRVGACVTHPSNAHTAALPIDRELILEHEEHTGRTLRQGFSLPGSQSAPAISRLA